jgi:hypothetical protein
MSRRQRKTEEDLLAELACHVEKDGGKMTASSLGFTPPFIWDVIHRRRGMTEKLSKALGYRRIVEFERLEDD